MEVIKPTIKEIPCHLISLLKIGFFMKIKNSNRNVGSRSKNPFPKSMHKK